MASFFRRLRLRFKDMGTIKTLCESAEQIAGKRDEGEPGEEHLLLAALELADGTALRALQRLGVNADQVENALSQQHLDALGNLGIDESNLESGVTDGEEAAHPSGLYQSKPSAQTLMQELADLRREDKDIPLLGAHILQVLSRREFGVAARTLNALGVTREALEKAVAEELVQPDQTGFLQ